jgi:hypothetical protein
VSTKKFTKKVFAWLYQIKNDRELPPSGALFALQLIVHFNEKKGGACWASCDTIAKGIGMSEQTAVRLYHLFEQRGHLKVEWGKQGSGHSNRGWMIVKKPPPMEVSKVKKTSTGDKKTSTHGGEPSYNHLKPSSNEEGIKRERVRASRSPPHDGAGRLEAAAPSKKKEVGAPAKQNDFAELAAIWQRGWLDDDEQEARKAFTEACREADPEEIITGARAWVAAADAPRYLKPLPKWLAARGWEKAPPKKRERGKHHRSLGDAMREAGERKAADTDDTIHYK